MDKPTIIKRGIMAVLTVLVITYVIYVVCRAGFTQVKTITAKETIAYNAIPCDSFVIHDETLITYDGEGVISYMFNDGDKVSVNETVAGVFDSVISAGTQREMDRLRSKIDSLKLLNTNSDAITQTPDELDRSVRSYLIQANLAACEGRYQDADSCSDNALYCINERQLVTGKNNDYKAKQTELEQQLKELEQSEAQGKKSKEIKAPNTGYFVSSADGYENIFKVSELENIMPDDMGDDKIKPAEVSDKVIGKTVNGVYWYVACPVSAESALKIKNADTLQLDIPVVSSEKIDVELFSINQKSKSSDAVVMLRGTFMNDQMASLRKGRFSIILDTYDGIYVPKTAVHEMELTRTVKDDKGKEKKETKTVSGVYVKVGNEVAFREIVPVYSGEDYIISSLNTKDKVFSKDTGAVQVYDDIIVEGANLYDGKIINRSS